MSGIYWVGAIGVMLISPSLADVEVWRSDQVRADCKNRIKEIKAGFCMDSFARNGFGATKVV